MIVLTGNIPVLVDINHDTLNMNSVDLFNKLDGAGAILNTGECNHNVHFTEDNTTRIVFQLCFEEVFSEVCDIYDKKLKMVLL